MATNVLDITGQQTANAIGEVIKAKIRDFIAHNLLFSEQDFPYDDDASFLKEGVIDSLGVIELVTFVGKEFRLQVEPVDVTPENFDSVNRLAGFVQRKQFPTTEAHHARP